MPIHSVNFLLPTTTTLYTHNFCPFAHKVLIALKLSNFDYDTIEVDLYGNSKPKELVTGQVPVFIVNQQLMTESEDILDYIQTNDMIFNDINLDKRKWYKNIMGNYLLPAGKKAVLRRSTSDMFNILKEIEEYHSSSSSFNFLASKDLPSITDCSVFPFLYRIDTEFGINENEYPSLSRWLKQMLNMTQIRETIPNSWWWWW